MTFVPMLDVRQLTNMERHVRQIIASDEDRLEKAKRALKSLGDLPRGKQRVVKEQMRLVVGDLENVLGELKDVVGDLQVLVDQIDAVTDRIDEEYGPDFRNNERRKSTSNIENKNPPETKHCKSKSFHHIELEPGKKALMVDSKKSIVTSPGSTQELTSPVWQLRSITSAINESHPQMSMSYTPEMYYYTDYPDPRFNDFSHDPLMNRFLNSRMSQSLSSHDSHLTQSSVLSSNYNSDKTEGVMCRSSDTSGIMLSSKDSKMGESFSEPEYACKTVCHNKEKRDAMAVSASDSNNNDSLKSRKDQTAVRCGQFCSSDKRDGSVKAIACGNTERLLRPADDAVSEHDTFSMTSSTRSVSSCGRDPNHLHCGPSCTMSPDSDYCGVYEREFEMKVELEYDDDLDNYYGIDECLSVELESFKECNIKYRDRNLNNDIWSNYLATKDVGDDTDLDEDPFVDSADVSSDLLNENMAASSIPTSPSDFGDYITWERSIDGSSDFD